ncbi:MAG TPA: FimV/HubP family polar landmark protein [Burkholderiales bacterium]|nr:FimV/HubP family polar landmark protein [Burkholderiales bacterium]
MLAAALLAVPFLVHAAGLGKLTVLSALGQPLSADVQIEALQPGDADSLKASLASQDAFSSAGVQFNPVLLGMKFAFEHRGTQVVLHLSTSQPVSDPFLDVLIELQWASGRLVREYTFLLDPPDYGKGPQPIAAVPLPTPAAAQPPAPATAVEHPIAPVAGVKPAGTYVVKKGDTLAKIARHYMGSGVTLNQMLVALYRANTGAFIHANINLVRAGRILNIPGAETASAIDPDEARRVVTSQMRQFAEYRRKLAAAVAAREAHAAPSERTAAGRITEKQAETAPPEGKDRLTLSKMEPNHPSSAVSKAATGDDRVAREQALKDAQSRVADLEKNVTDLRKLLDLRNAQIAELEKKAVAPAAPAPMAIRPSAVAKPAPAAASPKPAVAPKPHPAAAPKPTPKAVTPPPPSPSLMDDFLDNPLALGGLAIVIVLLAGYGVLAWRRKKAAQNQFQESVTGGVDLGGVSVLGGAAQHAVEPGLAVSQVSVSPTGLGPIETEEVDPIAEADVYMAYGRDAQAEEILKEALQKDANRTAIHAKLLEIYANRRDTKAFERAALKLKELTHGAGPEWDKATKLGRTIEPQNNLYAGALDDTVRLTPGAPAPAATPALDFDLGGTTTGGGPDGTTKGENTPGAEPALDFDLGTTTAPAEEEKTDFAPGGTLIMGSEETKAATGTIDFDLGSMTDEGKPQGAAPQAFAPTQGPNTVPAATAASGSAGAIDFDFNLDLGEEKAATPPAAAQTPLDLSSISLDLGAPGGTAAAATNTDPKWQEVATKLDLAKAYEEMGDKDGARELLNEALKEGDAAQQSQAQQMLANLG